MTDLKQAVGQSSRGAAGPPIWGLALALFCVLTCTGRAADPAWWSARGAVAAGSTPAPYAVVNQGQLKQFTVCAVRELNAELGGRGGAGDALNTLVTGWQQDYVTNGYATDPTNPDRPYKSADFTVVTIGQLKSIASLLYARLQSAGYVASAPAWLRVNTATDNQLAVLGQLKSVFNFDPSFDPSGSGLPIAWELQYFGHLGVDPDADADGDGMTNLQEYRQGSDPTDPFNGVTPTLVKDSGDLQTGSPGTLLPSALAIRVVDGAGTGLVNAPVIFFVMSGGGQFQAGPNATPTATATVRTDSNGQARAYFVLPLGSPTTCQILASTAYGRSAQQTVQLAQPFTVQSIDNGGPPPVSPFAITDCIETVNDDGSEDLTWTNSPDNLNPIPIWSLVNGQWIQVDTVPAGTSFYHFPKP